MKNSFLNNKSLLITGGTGSLGNALIEHIIYNHKKIKKVIIFSRDELKQYEMSKKYNEKKYSFIRYFLGDVRDKDRLKKAFEGVDYIIHAAALKHVPAAEYNPSEFIKTNIIGAQNIVDVAISCGVKKVIALSTDKAAAPINLYGATKLCSDKIFTSSNNIKGNKEITFSVVRYGNVMGSRGSVIPLFLKTKEKGVFNLTHKDMTRFNITLKQSVDMVIWSLKNSIGGEIFVPKIPSYRLIDLAKAIAPNNEIKFVGIRPGEKIHEEMITASDSFNTFDIGKYFAIVSQSCNKSFKKYKKFKKYAEGQSYSSKNNKKYLTVSEIKKLIKNYEYN